MLADRRDIGRGRVGEHFPRSQFQSRGRHRIDPGGPNRSIQQLGAVQRDRLFEPPLVNVPVSRSKLYSEEAP